MSDTPDIENLAKNLSDPMWRISNLYKIIIKGDDGETNLVMQFKPNRAQRRFIKRLWYRNIILKARQLGFTTLIAIVWLDHALFNANVRCGIIAQDKEAAEVIFRDKVKFAYENLWPELKERFPLKRDSASELLFKHNNSSIRVATSMRSGTIHRLHVSEFGKICAKYPDKAKEVVTGSLQAVPLSGITVIESTAEGQDGEFYKMTQRALAAKQAGKKLNTKDYRMHFFPWWDEPTYCIDNYETVVISERDEKYFYELEAEIGQYLTPGQKAWYVATKDADFSGDDEKMWQEYPGTPEEAFQVSTEGCYFAQQLADVRKRGGILKIPVVESPVNTFWDIGRSDSTSIWFEQKVGFDHRFIRFYESSGELLGHYVKYLIDTGYIFGHHYLPHDAAHKRLSDRNKSIEDMLRDDYGFNNIVIVDRISNLQTGIQQARKSFAVSWFDEEGCKDGLIHLAGFKRAWNPSVGAWKDDPIENDHIHGADAFRQFGQALESGQYIGVNGSSEKSMKDWKTRERKSWRAT